MAFDEPRQTEPTKEEWEQYERRRDLLSHTLGAGGRNPGYRNYYCAEINGGPGYDVHQFLMAMVADGLMEAGRIINDGRDQYFHATKDGAAFIGLTPEQVARVFEN